MLPIALTKAAQAVIPLSHFPIPMIWLLLWHDPHRLSDAHSDQPTRNALRFLADRQVDRSPTGSASLRGSRQCRAVSDSGWQGAKSSKHHRSRFFQLGPPR